MSFRDTFNPFADMDKQFRDKCDNGYTLADLSFTAHTVFCALMGDNQFVRNQPWHQLADADKEMWEPVSRMAMCLMDHNEDAELQISVSATARNFYRQFTAMVSPPDYDTLPESHKIVWQALVRHLANLIDSDGKQSVPDMEERIIEWARNRISGPQTVLA